MIRATPIAVICLAGLWASGSSIAAEDSSRWSGPREITHPRPAWLRGGIVLAGNWSTQMQRRQRINAPWTQMGYGLSDDAAQEAYLREFTPEMADRLKELGVTLVMLPLWSGMGSEQDERPGMEDTRRFAVLLHKRGMRVGVYIHQGMLSRGFLNSRPESYDWLAWPSFASTYTTPPLPETEQEGYPVYRNHPAYQAFMRGMIDYAVKQVKADFLHFDNYVYGSGLGPVVMADFQSYLRSKYAAARPREEFSEKNLAEACRRGAAGIAPESHDWASFQAWILGESYRKLADYARSLNPEIATDVNASGLGVSFRRPIDLSQLVPQGDAFWDEQASVGWKPNGPLLNTTIRTYKLARLYHQNALTYTADRLRNIESLAFNYDSQGCLYWFLYGRLNWAVGVNSTADKGLMPETRFYREHRDLFSEGETLADMAVLRGRAVNLSGPDEAVQNAYLFEQALITQHVPFEIIFDQHLADLSKYRAVVLPDMRMLDDGQIQLLLAYVRQGGGLIVTDQSATQDEWGRPQSAGVGRLFSAATQPSGITLQRFEQGRLVYARIRRPEIFVEGSLPRNSDELMSAVMQALGGPLSIQASTAPHVGAEYIRQRGRVLVNLVDYARVPEGVPVEIRISANSGRVKSAQLLSPRTNTQDLKIVHEGQGSVIRVPSVSMYGVAAIDLE